MPLPYSLPFHLKADPYGKSPLVDDLAARLPGQHAAASKVGPPPTLFASSDLPSFTASGVAPDLLAELPYHWRHAAASEPDRAKVLDMLERIRQERDVWGSAREGIPHAGFEDYKIRMERWANAATHAESVSFEDATYPSHWLPAAQTA